MFVIKIKVIAMLSGLVARTAIIIIKILLTINILLYISILHTSQNYL